MTTLQWITVAALAGGACSAVIAGLLSFSARREWIPALVSFAVGALLGAAFLELLPHAFSASSDPHRVAATVLAGILGFFILEKLVIWRHSHGEDMEDVGQGGEAGGGHREGTQHAGHAHSDHGRSGMLILIGDSFHNFVDGILIAGAFMESTQLGIVTATAVIVHEVPQEVGDYLVLLHSGYGRIRAFSLNLAASGAMLIGSYAAYFGLRAAGGVVSTFIALAAASMIYVAVADLIPGLHRRPELTSTVKQVLLIGIGVALIALVGMLTRDV